MKRKFMKYIHIDFLTMLFSGLGGVILNFVLPIAPFLTITFSLVVVDTITGISAAKKRAEKISSKGLSRTVEKVALYCVLLLVAQGVKLVFLPVVPITYIAAFAIMLTEFQSIVENVETVTGAKIWDFIKNKLKN
jgi:phage-related holin